MNRKPEVETLFSLVIGPFLGLLRMEQALKSLQCEFFPGSLQHHPEIAGQEGALPATTSSAAVVGEAATIPDQEATGRGGDTAGRTVHDQIQPTTGKHAEKSPGVLEKLTRIASLKFCNACTKAGEFLIVLGLSVAMRFDLLSEEFYVQLQDLSTFHPCESLRDLLAKIKAHRNPFHAHEALLRVGQHDNSKRANQEITSTH